METRRSYLFVTWEGGGNVPPVLGLARRLAARGHTVRVLTEPCLERAVREAGARFLPFTRHFVREDRTEDIIGGLEAQDASRGAAAVNGQTSSSSRRGSSRRRHSVHWRQSPRRSSWPI